MYVCTVRMYVRMYVCTVRMYVRMYVCMYVCMRVVPNMKNNSYVCRQEF